MKKVGVALLLAFVMSPCALASQPKEGQLSDFKALLSGKVFPLTVKLKDLDNGWRRFTGGGAETAGYSQVWHRLFASTGSAFYTKGDIVSVAGETYLVAYSLQLALDKKGCTH